MTNGDYFRNMTDHEIAQYMNGCVIYGDEGTMLDLKMATWDMPTNGLEDGMIIKVPGGERLDIVEECDPAVDGSLEEWTAGEESKFDKTIP